MKDTVNEVKKNLSELDYLLGENNVEDIKKRIGDLIVDRIASDLRAYDYYLFYPEDYTETHGLQLRSCHKCEHCNFNRCKFYEDYYWKAHDGICAEEGFINFKEKVD